MDELKQALDNVGFLKEILSRGSYTMVEAPKVVSALNFLMAIETGVSAKKAEVESGSK